MIEAEVKRRLGEVTEDERVLVRGRVKARDGGVAV